MCFAKKHIFNGLLAFAAFSAHAENIPNDLANLVSQKNGDSKILASTSCSVGSSKTAAIGLLVQRSNNKNPLAIYMATMQNQTWNLVSIPTDVNHPRGGDSNILENYWDSDKGLIGPPYGILCTDLPNAKEFIGKKHNGVYDKPFTEKSQRNQKHLCFSASAIYNSWVCYNLSENNLQPQRVYTQFNSD